MSQPSCFRFLTLDLTGMRRHLRNVFSRVKLKSDFIPVVIWIEFETSCSVLDFLGDSDCNCDSDSHIWFDFWPLASAHSFSPAGCVGRGSKSEVEVAEARGCSANDGATSIPKGHSSKIISKGGFCETSAKGCRGPTDCLPKNTTKGGTGCLRGTTAKGCTGRKGHKGCLPETTAEDDATASDSKISTWGWGPSSRECSASSIGKCTGREGSCWETYLRDQTSNSLQHQLIRWVRNGDWGGLGRKFQAFYESEEGDWPLPSEEKDDDDQSEARFSPCEGGEAGDGETTKKGWSSSASADPGETRAGWRSPSRRSGPKHRALHDDWSLEPSQTWTREGWDAKRSLIRQLVTKLIQCRNPGGYLGDSRSLGMHVFPKFSEWGPNRDSHISRLKFNARQGRSSLFMSFHVFSCLFMSFHFKCCFFLGTRLHWVYSLTHSAGNSSSSKIANRSEDFPWRKKHQDDGSNLVSTLLDCIGLHWPHGHTRAFEFDLTWSDDSGLPMTDEGRWLIRLVLILDLLVFVCCSVVSPCHSCLLQVEVWQQ